MSIPVHVYHVILVHLIFELKTNQEERTARTRVRCLMAFSRNSCCRSLFKFKKGWTSGLVPKL